MSTTKNAARAARRSSAVRYVARIGFVVVGVIHVIIGSLAISLALGGPGDADQDGALGQVRENPMGGALLIGIAIALIALAAWQIASAFLATDPHDTKKWARRVKLFGIALAYLVIAGMALIFSVGGSVSSEKAYQTISAVLLAAPAGVVLLVILGLIVIAVGGGFVVSGFTRGFEELIDLPSGVPRRIIMTLGVIGYIGKGIAVALTGVLFVVAAVTGDPDKAAGLDAALRSLVELPMGSLILGAVGAGLAIYGAFCIARARYPKM